MTEQEYAYLHYLLGKVKFIFGIWHVKAENKKTKESLNQHLHNIDKLLKELPIDGKEFM